jgi:hypothetical protein
MGAASLERPAMIELWPRGTGSLLQNIRIGMLLPVLFALVAHSVRADETAVSKTPTMIVVVGASGVEQFESMFAEWADRWIAAAQQAGLHVIVIGRDTDATETDRQRLRSAIDLAAKSPGIELWLVMIGHGTFDRREARFNLRGPDVSARELADWLKPVDRPMAIINCASASAPFVTALASPKRVLIASTKSGSEQNFARFGDFMSQAIVDPTADLDKDDQTSLWEAFLKAARRTAEYYSTDGRLLTEHAVLDDTGDGQGVRSDQFRGLTPIEQTSDGKPLDGQRAHQWHLVRNLSDQSLSLEVRQKRDGLEDAILKLKTQKKSLASAEYLSQLERLLVELAELNESAGR